MTTAACPPVVQIYELGERSPQKPPNRLSGAAVKIFK
jgi:hypothetical protein